MLFQKGKQNPVSELWSTQESMFLLGTAPSLKKKVQFVNRVGLWPFAAQKFCLRVGCAGLTQRIHCGGGGIKCHSGLIQFQIYINQEQNGEDLQIGLVKKGHIWNLFKIQQKLGRVLDYQPERKRISLSRLREVGELSKMDLELCLTCRVVENVL